MTLEKLVTSAQKYFPDLQVKYKDQSLVMKLLGILMFFNRFFMIKYTTTIGSKIYFPSAVEINKDKRKAQVTLLHELVHMHDAKKISKFLFSFLYLAPITLLPFTIPFVLLSWKIALILGVLCVLPIPAYWRMKFEKRAYLVSIYCCYKLHAKDNHKINFEELQQIYLANFTSASYYFMWPFSLEKEFALATEKVKANQHPYEDPELFAIIDELIDGTD